MNQNQHLATSSIGLVAAFVFLVLSPTARLEANEDCTCEDCYFVTFPDAETGKPRTLPACLDLEPGGWFECLEIGGNCALVLNCEYIESCNGPHDPLFPLLFPPLKPREVGTVSLEIASACPTLPMGESRAMVREGAPDSGRERTTPRILYSF